MKAFFIVLCFALAACSNSGSFTDSRDGKTYKTVKIGKQVWLAENLNYEAAGSKCYNNEEDNCKTYGQLYDWETAMKTCPSGWHLPTNAEWDALYRYADGSSGTENPYPYRSETAGKFLKAREGWNYYNEQSGGTDNFGFAALPGGRCLSGKFNYIGDGGYWWSASESRGDDYAYHRHMSYDEDALFSAVLKIGLYSVRCLRD